MINDKVYDRIHAVAILHTNGRYAPRMTTVPGDTHFQESAKMAEWLSYLHRPYFQFSPLSSTCWACVCATIDNSFSDDHRRGTLPFAFLFSQAQAEKLLEVPNRLCRLRKWMEELPQETVLKVLEEGLDGWPKEVLSAPAERQTMGRTGEKMLQVMMQDLYERPCYAFCEDENELLAMLQTLPPKLRLSFSFASSYVRVFSDLKIQFYTSGPPPKLTDGPTRKRFDIGDGLPAPKVSPQAAKLAELIQELRNRNVLDEMDNAARDQEALKSQLHCLTQIRTYLENREGKAARKLLKQKEATVSGLVRWLCPEDQQVWAQLTAPGRRRRRNRAWAEEENLVPLRWAGRPGRDAGGRPLAAALMAAVVLIYLLAGTRLTELADRLYLTIQFAGGDALQLALGVIIGLCAGCLLFHRGGNEKQ